MKSKHPTILCNVCHENKKHHAHGMCDSCYTKWWKRQFPAQYKAKEAKQRIKNGHLPYSQNKTCPMFLGVHVAEQVLAKVFKNVIQMPINNPGYDFICNKGMKIDVKSSCLRSNGQWTFEIHKNQTADYFLCLAFDNRQQLTPLHAWLLPGKDINHLVKASISKPTLSKWDAHELDIHTIVKCCDSLR